MKRYLLDLVLAIPLAIGLVLTVLGISNAVASTSDPDQGVVAFFFALIGVPLLYASTAAILRRGRNEHAKQSAQHSEA